MFNLIRMDLRCALGSRPFWGAVLILLLISAISTFTEYRITQGNSSIIYYSTFFLSGELSLMSIVVAALPYSNSFGQDWHNQLTRYEIVRATPGAYAWSKYIVTALSSFLAVFLAYMVSVAVLALRSPLSIPGRNGIGFAASGEQPLFALINSQPILYLCCRMALIAIHASFWAVFALWISTLLNNVFIVLASPLIAYYLIINVSSVLKLPRLLDLRLVYQGLFALGDWWMTFLYALLFFGSLSAFLGWLFSHNVKRLIAHG